MENKINKKNQSEMAPFSENECTTISMSGSGTGNMLNMNNG